MVAVQSLMLVGLELEYDFGSGMLDGGLLSFGFRHLEAHHQAFGSCFCSGARGPGGALFCSGLRTHFGMRFGLEVGLEVGLEGFCLSGRPLVATGTVLGRGGQ
jgi:hypothetical protein